MVDSISWIFSSLRQAFISFSRQIRGHDGSVAFEVNEIRDVVFRGEASECMSFVLENAMFDVAGHSDVEQAALAGEDVDVVNLGHFLSMLTIAGWDRDECHKSEMTVPEWNYETAMSF